MRQRELGSSGLQVSVVGLGCNNFGWRIDEQATQAVVDGALAAGITFFDTAESYGNGESERFLGRALAGRRDEVVIATKFGWGKGHGDNDVARGSRAYIRSAVEGSLERLGTDYIDLYQYHRPDGMTPIAETLGALGELVTEGKVRTIGSSQMTPEQVFEADTTAAGLGITRFETAQNNYNLLEREAEDGLTAACAELGLGLIPFFPLARGLLSGKYRRDAPVPEGTRLTSNFDVSDEQWTAIETLEAYAARQSVSLLDVAIGGLLTQPVVCSVIAGATTAAQAAANAAAAAWEPDAEAIAELRAL